jgi:hypothetical protein
MKEDEIGKTCILHGDVKLDAKFYSETKMHKETSMWEK